MKLSIIFLIIIVIVTVWITPSEECNVGLGNKGVGNVGFGNIGVLNRGIRNKGLMNRGRRNFGALNSGRHNIGFLNRRSSNTIGFANFLARRRIGAFNIFTVRNPKPG